MTEKVTFSIEPILTKAQCYVHNVLDTAEETPPSGYDNFLEYWKKKSGQKATECMAIGQHVNSDGDASDKKEIVGAHVRIDGRYCPDDEAWIVPLCKHCNSEDRTWHIRIGKGTTLVPVKMSKPHKTASNPSEQYVNGVEHLYKSY